MNIVLCGDSQETLSYYSDLIKTICKQRGLTADIKTYSSPKALLFDAPDMKEPIDILLLDSMMPSSDGDELGRLIRDFDLVGRTIFLSASNNHAVEAFCFKAFDCVRKDNKNHASVSKCFEEVFLEALDEAQNHTSKFVTFNGITEHRNIPLDAIRYFDVNRNIITVHYNADDEFQIVSSLSTVENKLLAYGFIRIYRAYLVNCAAIEQFNSSRVMLFDGTELPIGRGKYQKLLQVMADYSEPITGSGTTSPSTSENDSSKQ